MSSPSRPSESLQTFKATLILQCFAMVKLFLHAYMVLCRPWNTFETVVVTTFFVVDVIFVIIAFSETAKQLWYPQFCAFVTVFFTLILLLVLYLARKDGVNFERMKKEAAQFDLYFFTTMDSDFSYITFALAIIIVHITQINLTETVRLLKDPEYKKRVEEMHCCGIKINKNTADEIV